MVGLSLLSGPLRLAVESSIVVEDAVENRDLLRVFIFRACFQRGFRHVPQKGGCTRGCATFSVSVTFW